MPQLKRRAAVRAAIVTFATVALPSLAASKQKQSKESANPVTSSSPYDLIQPSIKTDSSIVRLFFSYDCPHCRSYHNGLVQWGNSLPRPLQFVAVPLVTSPTNADMHLAVVGRLIGHSVSPAKLSVYDYKMYEFIQGDPAQGISPKSNLAIDDVLRALVDSGVNASELQRFLKTKAQGIEQQITKHGEIIKRYGLTATPSVSIGGVVTLNPDHAQANPQQFLLLLNGLVSRYIQGGMNAV